MLESSSGSASLYLMCDEEPCFLSSPTASPKKQAKCFSCSSSLCPPVSAFSEERDRELFHKYLQKEAQYTPCKGYLQQLKNSPFLSPARTRAVCRRMNLAIGTAFNAVNYLDRFISLNSTVKWERWMMELLSIACLSIASKLDEVCIPSFHEFQVMMDAQEHLFEKSTIQEMELTVLKALSWRLWCVTPYSYVADVFPRWSSHVEHVDVHTDPIHLVTQLLLHALLDVEFLDFRASIMAAAALRCVSRSDHDLSIIAGRLIQVEYNTEEMQKCQKMMEKKCSQLWSPNPAIIHPIPNIL